MVKYSHKSNLSQLLRWDWTLKYKTAPFLNTMRHIYHNQEDSTGFIGLKTCRIISGFSIHSVTNHDVIDYHLLQAKMKDAG